MIDTSASTAHNVAADLSTATDVSAFPEAEPNLIRGPWLHCGNDSSITIRWSTATAEPSSVWIGARLDHIDLVYHDPQPTHEHLVELTGLTPNTRYFYSVGYGTSQTIPPDPASFFDTQSRPEDNNAVTFWVVGDRGRNSADQQAVLEGFRMVDPELSPAFWIMLGDNAYEQGTHEEYQQAIFVQDAQMLARAALFPTEGNHDACTSHAPSQTGPYYEYFSVPTEGELGGTPSHTAAYYSFDSGPVHIVSLNSVESMRLDPAQLAWLERDLEQASAPWKLVCLHHPPYTKGSHDSDTERDLLEVRTMIAPILERHGVALVLAGHSHSYERTNLIRGHYGPSNSFTSAHVVDCGQELQGEWQYTRNSKDGGTVYVVAGTSGRADPLLDIHPAMRCALSELGSLTITADAQTLRGQFIDTTGRIRDAFAIVRSDVTGDSLLAEQSDGA